MTSRAEGAPRASAYERFALQNLLHFFQPGIPRGDRAQAVRLQHPGENDWIHLQPADADANRSVSRAFQQREDFPGVFPHPAKPVGKAGNEGFLEAFHRDFPAVKDGQMSVCILLVYAVFVITCGIQRRKNAGPVCGGHLDHGFQCGAGHLVPEQHLHVNGNRHSSVGDDVFRMQILAAENIIECCQKPHAGIIGRALRLAGEGELRNRFRKGRAPAVDGPVSDVQFRKEPPGQPAVYLVRFGRVRLIIERAALRLDAQRHAAARARARLLKLSPRQANRRDAPEIPAGEELPGNLRAPFLGQGEAFRDQAFESGADNTIQASQFREFLPELFAAVRLIHHMQQGLHPGVRRHTIKGYSRERKLFREQGLHAIEYKRPVHFRQSQILNFP